VSRGHAGQSQEFEVYLAPLIDCFTVLIAFVMISTAFASVGILDAGVAAGGEKLQPTTPPPVRVGVEMQSNHQLMIHLSGKETRTITVKSGSTDWDLAELQKDLKVVKQKWPSTDGAVLRADDNVSYNDVVRSMDTVRAVFPAVMLGGI